MFNKQCSITFKYLIFIGIWRPVFPGSPMKKLAYNVYTVFVFLLQSSMTLSQIIDTLFFVNNASEISDNIFMLLTIMSTCFRVVNVVAYRRELVFSLKMLTEDPCKPCNAEEDRIQRKYDELIRRNILAYTMWIEGTVITFIANSVMRYGKSKELMFRGWYPYDYESTGPLWLPYMHQAAALIIGSLIHISTDSLISGLMLQVCSQIEILEHRLQRIPSENDQRASVQKCARQHYIIHQYATQVNKIINMTMTAQFCASSLIMCTTSYVLLKHQLFSLDFISMFLYLCCMLLQMYIYCFYGTVVTSKSARVVDTIFGMDWVPLSIDLKKSLLMMMRRATFPIVLKGAIIINLNLDSFVHVLKIAYSAYNVLSKTG